MVIWRGRGRKRERKGYIDLVHDGRKAPEIIDEIRVINSIDSRHISLPMSRDHKDGLRPLVVDFLLPFLKELPCWYRLINRHLWRPMRYVECLPNCFLLNHFSGAMNSVFFFFCDLRSCEQIWHPLLCLSRDTYNEDKESQCPISALQYLICWSINCLPCDQWGQLNTAVWFK